ncbi:MAG: PilZ domain-containing protein [Nitrospiraceae bacterium]
MEKYYTCRAEARQPLRCKFQYFLDECVSEGTVWDLSSSGWRASGTAPVTVGMEMPVCLYLGNEKRWVSIGRAAVRWVKGSNFGLEVVQIDTQEQERLDHFLEKSRLELPRPTRQAV